LTHGIAADQNSNNDSCGNNSDDDGGDTTLPLRNVPAKKKYDSLAAELYRQVLQARVDGLPEPTELQVLVRTESSVSQHSAQSSSLSRKETATATTNNGVGRRAIVDKSRIQGFGSNGINNNSSGTVGGGCIPSNGSGKRRTVVQKCLWVTATVVTLGGALWFVNHH
jgi:hypothetical protein